MYKAVKKTKFIRRYMEALVLHTGAHTVYLEDNTSFISVVESKIVTPGVKRMNITVCFLKYQFENGLFIPKYENQSVMPEYMCTKPCSGPISSRSNKWMTGFRFYPTIYIEHYKLMMFHEFIVNSTDYQENI